MEKKRYGILLFSAVLLLFCGLIYAWSLFRTPFGEQFPAWTLSQLSMTFTISMIFFCLGGFLSGRLLMNHGAGTVLSISACFVLAGFLGVSLLKAEQSTESLYLLYLCYGVLGGTGIGLSYNAVLSTVSRLFPDQPGLASGMMLLGFGMGGLILGSVATGMIKAQGLFMSFRILAFCMFAVLLIGAWVIGNTDKQSGRKTGDGRSAKEKQGIPAADMLKTPSFWIFITWNIITNSAGLMVVNSAASIAAAFGAPAIVGMVVSLCNGIGRLLIGGIFDRMGRARTMALDCMLEIGSGVMLIAGAFTANAAFIICGLVLAGFFYSGAPTIAAAFIRKEYGEKYYSVNFSIANFSLIPAALIGPTLSSSLISSSGSYITTFAVIAACGFLSICTLPVLKRTVRG